MRFSHLLMSIPVFFVIACSSTPPPSAIKTETAIIKHDFSEILDVNFRGQFSLNNGKAWFKTCDTDKTFPVHANASLRNIYEQITITKFTPVYIEFTGELVFPSAKDKNLDVLMRIDRVHHMAPAKASLQCAKPVHTFLFKAQGNEPYWRLNISDQKLFFATKASNQAYQVKEGNFQTAQVNRVQSINEEGQALNLTIEPGHCYNLKNGEYWGYTATVDSIWGELKGCGEPGWPIIEHKFSGYYLSREVSKTANLTLNRDYTVNYKEEAGDKTSIKTGFWKSNSPDRVIVMLTQQENKNIREELVFYRNGLALHADKINQNNIVTDFSAPGIIFNKMNSKEVEESTSSRIDRQFTAQGISPKGEIDLEIQKAVNQYFRIHRTDPKNTGFNSVKYDLNGDGSEEAIVLLDWCSLKGCEMLIFEGLDTGYRFSSRVSRVQAPITIAKTQHYLWQSLLIENNAQWFIIDFDGISYPIDSRDFKLVDNHEKNATGVILFNQGIPKTWFPIKM